MNLLNFLFVFCFPNKKNMNFMRMGKQILQQRFHTKDLGKLPYFLGIEVVSWIGINLSHIKYVLDSLEKTGLWGDQPAEVLMDPN
jgi:hypothetical protein